LLLLLGLLLIASVWSLQRGNKVARWVATSIVIVPELKLRAKVLARFIRIADVSGTQLAPTHVSLFV
jgi:hypothetical protein